MRPTLFLIALILFVSIWVPATPAQSPITPDTEQGMKPYGDFHGGDFDQVSLSNGKLVLNIPLSSYPQRGGKIKVGFSLQWSGVVIRSTQVCYATQDTCFDSGLRDAASGGTLFTSDDLQWDAFTFNDAIGTSWAEASAPDGAQHLHGRGGLRQLPLN